MTIRLLLEEEEEGGTGRNEETDKQTFTTTTTTTNTTATTTKTTKNMTTTSRGKTKIAINKHKNKNIDINDQDKDDEESLLLDTTNDDYVDNDNFDNNADDDYNDDNDNNNDPHPHPHHQQYHKKIFRRQYLCLLFLVGFMICFLSYYNFLETNNNNNNNNDNNNSTTTSSLSSKIQKTKIKTNQSNVTNTTTISIISSSSTTSSPTTPTPTSTPTFIKGNLYICGWDYPNFAKMLFPDYQYMGMYKRSYATIHTSTNINATNSTSTTTTTTNRHHVIVVGMTGPCDNIPESQLGYYFFPKDDQSKILFLNGEPFGIMPHPTTFATTTMTTTTTNDTTNTNHRYHQDQIFERYFQISGPVPSVLLNHNNNDDDNDNNTNNSSNMEREFWKRHFLPNVYMGIYNYLNFYPTWIDKLIDPKKRPKWIGYDSLVLATAVQQEQDPPPNDNSNNNNDNSTLSLSSFQNNNNNINTTLIPQSRIIYVTRNCQRHRTKIATALAQILPVDTPKNTQCSVPNGHSIPIPGSQGDHMYNYKLYQNYKYCITMDNTNIIGYISEKITYGFLGGCIPIAWGSYKELTSVFNIHAFLWADPNHPELLIQEIMELERNTTAYMEKINAPIIAGRNDQERQDTINKYFSYSDTIGDGSMKQKIRTMMGIE